jgi:hypothetical protein
MRRFLLRLGTGTSLLAALLTCGCQHNRYCRSKCFAPAAVAKATPPASSSRAALAANAPAQASPASSPAASSPMPNVPTTAELGPLGSERSSVSPPSLMDPSPDGQAPALERFGHDRNYRWLMGTLDYSRIQGAWLLRYAPFEEDDRYGGCVTLVGFTPPTSLKPGQSVRVEGELIDPESRQLRPAFQVRNLRVVGS